MGLQFAPMNVNDTVRVKLKPAGHVIYRKFYSRATQGKAADDDGWSTFQLWELMQIFGPYISLGCEVPFETEIEVKVTKWPTNTREGGSEMTDLIAKLELGLSATIAANDELTASFERVSAAARATKAALEAVGGNHGGVKISVAGALAEVEIKPPVNSIAKAQKPMDYLAAAQSARGNAIRQMSASADEIANIKADIINPDGLYSGASILRLVDAINAENKRRGIKVEFE